MRTAPWYTECRRPKRSVSRQANSAGITTTVARPMQARASASGSMRGPCGSSASSGTESATMGSPRPESVSRAQSQSASALEPTVHAVPVTGSPNCRSSSTEASRVATSGTFGVSGRSPAPFDDRSRRRWNTGGLPGIQPTPVSVTHASAGALGSGVLSRTAQKSLSSRSTRTAWHRIAPCRISKVP